MGRCMAVSKFACRRCFNCQDCSTTNNPPVGDDPPPAYARQQPRNPSAANGASNNQASAPPMQEGVRISEGVNITVNASGEGRDPAVVINRYVVDQDMV